MMFNDNDVAEARGSLITALAILTFSARMTPTRAARNLMFHAEEMLKALDAFTAGRDNEDADADQAGE